jgi:bifunctional non-homologous end joining protein LigD
MRSRAVSRGQRRRALPDFVEPQLCRLVRDPPSGENWVHEVKFDGYRMQLRVEKDRAALRTRRGLNWSEKFPEIVAEARKLPDCLIDGEVCALNAAGVPDFGALQDALSSGKTGGLIFYAFDLLFAQGEDLRSDTLEARKELLEALLLKSKSKSLSFVPHFSESGASMLQSACQMNMEGIVSKRLDAPYRSGRGDFWTKAKCRPGQEVVIGGWWGDDRTLRSIMVGAYRSGVLEYMGKIGTGFNQRNANDVLKALRPLKRPKSPFAASRTVPRAREIQWVEPKLVAEIAYSNVTRDGILRQASFKALRTDKPARDIMWEKPNAIADDVAIRKEETMVRKNLASKSADKSAPKKSAAKKPAAKADSAVLGIVISHPDKELWPSSGKTDAITKLDLARYYEMAADRLLPHLHGRPVSIVRAPDGIHGEHFFQRHAMQGTAVALPSIKTKGEPKPYLSVDSAEGLVALAQVGALELHPWGVKPGDPETPERIIFDFDPDTELDFARVIDAAREMKARLEKIGLTPFVKTTGGKGLHVVAPVRGTPKNPIDWPKAKAFAKGLSEQMAGDSPERYTTNMAKKQRGGKIFIDYLRNDKTSTAVGPWSPRARDGATIAFPIPWSAVKVGLNPKLYTIATAPALLKKADPWKDMAKAAAAIPAEKSTRR